MIVHCFFVIDIVLWIDGFGSTLCITVHYFLDLHSKAQHIGIQIFVSCVPLVDVLCWASHIRRSALRGKGADVQVINMQISL